MTTTDIATRRRRSRAAVVIGVLLLMALIIVTIVLRGSAIETDIENRAELAVAVQSVAIGEVRAEADGRDVTLFGSIQEDQVDYITDRIDNLWGVGSVTLDDGIEVVAATTTTAPVPTSTTSTTQPPASTTTVAATTTTSTMALAQPTLTIANDAITAVVPTPVVARRIEMAATVAGLDADVAVDATTADAPWLGGIEGAIISLRSVARPTLTLDGSGAVLGGEVADRDTRDQVTAAFAGLNVDVDDGGLSIAEAPDAATAAQLEAELNAAVADSSVLFGTGSADVSPAGAALLDRIAALLGQVPGARVEIQGHTDDEGPEDGNLILSQARADAVADYLIAAGVAPAQVTAVGYGESEPIADNTTEQGRAANRRIEFSVEGAS